MSDESEASVAGSKRKDPPSPPTSDDELLDENEDCRLNWRMDPEESHSDWSLEILVAGKTHSAYHVHKTALSVGPTRSRYFERLFGNKNFSEQQTSTSRIELEEVAAKAFPIMLDYLYSLWDDGKPLITHENAVALHYLGGYFEVRGLRKKARHFWEEEMNLVKLTIYFEHAKLLHDEKVYQAVVKKFCSINYVNIDMDVYSRLMDVSDAQFWLDVLEQNRGNPKPALSVAISDFCCKQKDQLDAETFLKLTDTTLLPELSAGAVMELLELEQLFLPESVSADELSNLQERCIKSVLSCRKNMSCRKNNRVIFASLQSHFKNLTPLVLSKMFALASEEMSAMENKLNVVESCLPFEVVVSGAGTSAVNGTYTRTGTYYDGAPCFAMDGVWDGVAVKFEVFAYNRKWYISIEGGEHDIIVYFVARKPPNTSAPPSTDWGLFGNIGSLPAPTVACRYHHDW